MVGIARFAGKAPAKKAATSSSNNNNNDVNHNSNDPSTAWMNDNNFGFDDPSSSTMNGVGMMNLSFDATMLDPLTNVFDTTSFDNHNVNHFDTSTATAASSNESTSTQDKASTSTTGGGGIGLFQKSELLRLRLLQLALPLRPLLHLLKDWVVVLVRLAQRALLPRTTATLLLLPMVFPKRRPLHNNNNQWFNLTCLATKITLFLQRLLLLAKQRIIILMMTNCPFPRHLRLPDLVEPPRSLP